MLNGPATRKFTIKFSINKIFVFGRNLTTNQPIDLKSYSEYRTSPELLYPLHHLPEYITTLCYRHYENRLTWVNKHVQAMEQYLGVDIPTLNKEEIGKRTDVTYETYLPTCERTRLTGVTILQKQYHSSHRTFSGFYHEYKSTPKPRLTYTPRTETEQQCYALLVDFLRSKIHGYCLKRSKIRMQTSCLAPYFALGVVGFEYLVQLVSDFLADNPENQDYLEFERQCHWILYCKLRARDQIDTTPPRPLDSMQQKRFTQWTDGTLPERNDVDRAINFNMQRLRDGYMISNRFRLMSSYYLVKCLGIDWQYGEYYFRCSLLDAHCLVNYYNWKWQCCHNRFFNQYNLSRQLAIHGD